MDFKDWQELPGNSYGNISALAKSVSEQPGDSFVKPESVVSSLSPYFKGKRSLSATLEAKLKAAIRADHSPKVAEELIESLPPFRKERGKYLRSIDFAFLTNGRYRELVMLVMDGEITNEDDFTALKGIIKALGMPMSKESLLAILKDLHK